MAVVDGASFSVRPGEIFGLLGPNGAGKTTTISVISTVLRPDGGSVRVDGVDVVRRPGRVRKLMGLVPQENALFPVLTARENVEYFAGIHGLSGGTLRRRVAEALEIVGLSSHADRPQVRFFSGGMLRRLNLAAGLVHRPRLLLLDEPTSGVDAQSRSLILANVRNLAREEGIAVVYTTHYMEEAETICDSVAIMDHGRILACDGVQELIRSAAGALIEIALARPADGFADRLASGGGVTEVSSTDGLRYVVRAADQSRGLSAVVAAAAAAGAEFAEMRVVPPSLEQVFLSLTGRDLRDRTTV